jgi:hypothetical protein
LEELSNEKGKLAEASEEGQGPRRAVEPMIMILIKSTTFRRLKCFRHQVQSILLCPIDRASLCLRRQGLALLIWPNRVGFS